MKKNLYYLLSITSIILVVICFILAFTLFYNHSYDTFTNDIKKQTESLKDYMDSNQVIDYQSAHLFQYRITLINEDGSVIYDNQKDNLENHSNREEVIEAFNTGIGEATRKSDSVNKDLFYYALLLDDGSVIRVSNDIENAIAYSDSFITFLIVSIILLIIINIIVVNRILNYTLRPIYEIDLDNPKDIEQYPEFKPFIEKINYHTAIRKEFSANVSHELKTPLQSILGYSELIASGMVKQDDIVNFSTKINDEAKRLNSMINDIIEISKLDDKQHTLELVNTRLDNLIQDSISKYTLKARNKNIVIIDSLKPIKQATNIYIFNRIINNLISNAIKYNKHEGRIWIELKENENTITLIIKDNGIGINSDDLPRIFERFFRADKSHNSQIDGSGLGLAIVKHSVELLQGTIDVTSKVNKHTTFIITFDKKLV